MNKSTFISSLLWTVVAGMCTATALSPSWTTFLHKSQPRSATLNAQNNPVCVHAAPNPNWAGRIDAQDCADALGRLWDRVLPYGYIQWTFWSSKFLKVPPPEPSWQVPQISEYGTCVVVFRMAKDLGDDVLPFHRGFEPTSQAPPSLSANWPDIVEHLLLLRSNCVLERKLPGWRQWSDAGLLLMLPTSSVMNKRWACQSLTLGNASTIISNLTLTS